MGLDDVDGLGSAVRSSLELYARKVTDAFGDRVHEFVLFGSQARGEGTDDSDVDVAVIIRGPGDEGTDRHLLVDLGAEVTVETLEYIQPWLLRPDVLDAPLHEHAGTAIHAIRTEGVRFGVGG